MRTKCICGNYSFNIRNTNGVNFGNPSDMLRHLKESPLSCLYTTSSSDPSLFNRTSWEMLISWADPLVCVCSLVSAAAWWVLIARILHLPQKVMNPTTVNTLSTSKIFHLLITNAMKDVGVLNPANRILKDTDSTHDAKGMQTSKAFNASV